MKREDLRVSLDSSTCAVYFAAIMRIEDFENATVEQLRAEANQCFEKAASWPNQPIQLHYLNQARFYLDEIENRENRLVSRRDFRMELIVIALIGLEIVAAVGLAMSGSRQQTNDVSQELKAFGDMQVVLTNLKDTSKATADTMTALETTTQTMNTALQRQLALFYEISIIPIWDPATKKIAFANTGRTNVSVWGNKFADEPARFEEEGRTISPAGSYTIPAESLYDKIVKRVPVGTEKLLPLDIYVRNDRSEEFVEHCFVGTTWTGDTLRLGIQVASVEPNKWRKGQKKVPARP